MKSPHDALAGDLAINLRVIEPAPHNVRLAPSIASGEGAAT
ncbi:MULTISPECIES: hypothetical protein [Achromobacter]|nr:MULTISPECIES: hypothetical protein [Achromobacter]